MSGFDLYNAVKTEASRKAEYAQSYNISFQSFRIAYLTYVEFFNSEIDKRAPSDEDMLLNFECFRQSFQKATDTGCIGLGGVPESNFLSIWIICNLFKPDLYVESGFFRGSSLYAAVSTGCIEKVIGFDPDHSHLNFDLFKGISSSIKLHSHDFSSHEFHTVPYKHLAYFDDHINTAKRIIESHEKGFKYLIFDDSCGLTGTSERMWPALPSLFFIMNVGLLKSGDFLSWPKESHFNFYLFGGRIAIKFRRKILQNRFDIDFDTLELCRDARSRILKCLKIPDLSDFIVNRFQSGFNDVRQHFVLLK